MDDIYLDMAGWTIQTDENHDPILPSASALSGRKLLLKTGEDINHPARSILSGWSRFANSYKKATLIMMKSRENYYSNEQYFEDFPELITDLVFRTAELSDAYSELPKSIVSLRLNNNIKSDLDIFKSIVKDCFRSWNLSCNKIKHNNNLFVCSKICFVTSNKFFEGVSLLRPDGPDGLMINSNFHPKKTRFVPVSLLMRQILHDSIRADRAAATLLSRIPEDKDAPTIPEYRGAITLGESIHSVNLWPLFTTKHGTSAADGLEICENHLRSIRVSATIPAEDMRFTALYSGDGITRHFPII